MQRRNIADYRRQARSGLGGSGGGAAAFSGVLDAIATAGGSANFFGSTSHRLGSAYTGPLIRVRKGTGGGATFLDVGYDASTNKCDYAAIETFGGADDVYLHTVYDQTGNARDYVQATEANQPKIYDGATTSVLHLGSLVAPTFDGGTSGAGDHLERADACGLSGAVACSVFYFGQYSALTYSNNFAMQVGALTAVNRLEIGVTSAGDPRNFGDGSNSRVFSEDASPTADAAYYVHRIGAGAGIHTSTCRQNGVDLVQSAVAGTSAVTFADTVSSIGSRSTGDLGAAGSFCAWAIFEADIAGAVLAAVEEFGEQLATDADGVSLSGLVVDSMLAAGAEAPLAAWSVSEALYSAHTDEIITVRRDSDDATLAISRHWATRRIDTHALSVFCAGANGFVVTVYDQSGNARDLTQATEAAQPKIWDATTGLIADGDLPLTAHDGGALGSGGGDWWTRADQLGISGNASLTFFTAQRHTAYDSFDRSVMAIGGTSNRSLLHGVRTSGALACGFVLTGYSTRAREFSGATATDFGYQVTSYLKGTNVNVSAMRWNGSLLTESAVDQRDLFAIEGNVTAVGANTLGARGMTGYFSTALVFGEYVWGAPLTALAAFGDSLVTSTGAAMPSHVLTDARPFYMFGTGQSNMEQSTQPEDTQAPYYGVGWVKSYHSGTAMDPYWLPPSGVDYVAMVSAFLALDQRVPAIHWRLQGESDATTTDLANAFESNELSMFEAFAADIARDLPTINVLLHTGSSIDPVLRASVNAGKTANDATFTSSTLLDPTSVVELENGDGVHWLQPAASAAFLPVVHAAALELLP